MKTRTPEEISSFLHNQVELWNAGKKTDMFTLYHQMVPGKLSIEYVGLPVLEGWTALEDMWQRFNGKVRIDVKEVMVTGNEAACFHHNQSVGVDSPPRPSIELYRFEGDNLQIRYFHVAKL